MGIVGLVQGVTFCFLWFFSIFFGFVYLYVPLMPLAIFYNYAFRTFTDMIFAFWELYPTALLQMVFGTKIYVHGDHVDTKETSVIVMNHRTRVDWNYLWLCMFHATRNTDESDKEVYECIQNGVSHIRVPTKILPKWLRPFHQKSRLKYVLKDEIKFIPGPGWVMQMNCFMYIKRNWEQDQAKISKVVKYLDDLDYTYQLLIFPEGTDLTESNLKKSNIFAKKNDLEPLKQLLHPRVRGFISLMQSMRGRIGAIYDITVGYSGLKNENPNQPLKNYGLKDMICGRFPKEVHFFIKRYNIATISNDENYLSEWLKDRWNEKEVRLENFYADGKFRDAGDLINHTEEFELKCALVYWTFIVVSCSLVTVFLPAAQHLLFISFLGFTLLTYLTGGFQNLEIASFEFKKARGLNV